MGKPSCNDCGTRLERNGVCPNCDEAAYIMDHQHDYLPDQVSDEFLDEAAAGHARAAERKPRADGGGKG